MKKKINKINFKIEKGAIRTFFNFHMLKQVNQRKGILRGESLIKLQYMLLQLHFILYFVS